MELQKRQRISLIFAQILFAAIGIVLAVNDMSYHETAADYIGAFLVQPLALAGLARLVVRAYQYCNLLIAIVCPVGVILGANRVFQASEVWGNILCIILLAIEAILFILDIRFLVKSRNTLDL